MECIARRIGNPEASVFDDDEIGAQRERKRIRCEDIPPVLLKCGECRADAGMRALDERRDVSGLERPRRRDRLEIEAVRGKQDRCLPAALRSRLPARSCASVQRFARNAGRICFSLCVPLTRSMNRLSRMT